MSFAIKTTKTTASKTKKVAAPKAEAIAVEAAPTIATDDREKLVAKAKAAKQAALVGLISQEEADAIWAQAVEACKPTEESLATAKAAKEEKDKAEKILKAAKGFSFGNGGGPRFKGQMSGLDAAYNILSESEKPLNGAMEQGLWTPDGLTPAATLSGALQTDVKKGDKARFVKVGAGLYAIRQS